MLTWMIVRAVFVLSCTSCNNNTTARTNWSPSSAQCYGWIVQSVYWFFHTVVVFKQTDWGFVLCSHKRKSESFTEPKSKKACLWEEQQPENTAEEMNSEKQTNAPETPSSEVTMQDDRNLAEKPGDTAQRILNLTLTTSLPSTQTATVSPLSQTAPLESTPDGSGREANLQKLAALEEEAQRLRRLLGLEVMKTTQGTMTTADTSSEKPAGGPVAPASREVGCQTAVAEVSRVYTQYFSFIMMTIN